MKLLHEKNGVGFSTSVIIPTYYRYNSVYQLLTALLNQTTKPNEVLIIDDTPTNDIENLFKKFKLKLNEAGILAVYVRKKERSISISRNLGAKTAHGDILIFLDSDILPFQDYIEKVLQVFKVYPNAIGVGGWFAPSPSRRVEGVRYFSNQILKKLFSLTHDSINSCKNFEYPISLSNTTYCQYLLGGTMSLRKEIFDEFQFDESLKKYSFGEDFLFSNLISKKYPNTLLISPKARCINVASEEARPKEKELFEIKHRNGKYILTKLWGVKGLFIFGRVYIGSIIIDKIDKIKAISK